MGAWEAVARGVRPASAPEGRQDRRPPRHVARAPTGQGAASAAAARTTACDLHASTRRRSSRSRPSRWSGCSTPPLSIDWPVRANSAEEGSQRGAPTRWHRHQVVGDHRPIECVHLRAARQESPVDARIDADDLVSNPRQSRTWTRSAVIIGTDPRPDDREAARMIRSRITASRLPIDPPSLISSVVSGGRSSWSRRWSRG